MNLGDRLAQQALTTGKRAILTATPPGIIRLAITLPDDSIQHFERQASGSESDWRAAEFATPGAGCIFDEPVTAAWGRGLNALTLAR
ncbi:hypothetical protein AB0G73_18815 [Streptomyces sp. NPDC020719]|uniref:hypothetical protein n=1 Tax=Streptomyces sp. NPDC020719 TaxID=3154896 RepID=UPI0033CF8637